MVVAALPNHPHRSRWKHPNDELVSETCDVAPVNRVNPVNRIGALGVDAAESGGQGVPRPTGPRSRSGHAGRHGHRAPNPRPYGGTRSGSPATAPASVTLHDPIVVVRYPQPVSATPRKGTGLSRIAPRSAADRSVADGARLAAGAGCAHAERPCGGVKLDQRGGTSAGRAQSASRGS